MGDIKIFTKERKRNRKLWTDYKNLKAGYRNEIWVEKYAIIMMKKKKRSTETTEAIKLPNQESIKTLWEKVTDIIKQTEIKERKDCFRRIGKLVETLQQKCHQRNKCLGILPCLAWENNSINLVFFGQFFYEGSMFC